MKEQFDWFSEDARLVQQQAEDELAQQQAWIADQDYLEALDEARHYFREHIDSLPIDDQEVALEGLYWYETHLLDDLDIDSGSWTYDLDTDSAD